VSRDRIRRNFAKLTTWAPRWRFLDRLFWQCDPAIICHIQLKYLSYKWLGVKHETWGHHLLPGSCTGGVGRGCFRDSRYSTHRSEFNHSVPLSVAEHPKHLLLSLFQSRLAIACSDGLRLNASSFLVIYFWSFLERRRGSFVMRLTRLRVALLGPNTCHDVVTSWECFLRSIKKSVLLNWVS